MRHHCAFVVDGGAAQQGGLIRNNSGRAMGGSGESWSGGKGGNNGEATGRLVSAPGGSSSRGFRRNVSHSPMGASSDIALCSRCMLATASRNWCPWTASCFSTAAKRAQRRMDQNRARNSRAALVQLGKGISSKGGQLFTAEVYAVRRLRPTLPRHKGKPQVRGINFL